MIETEPWSGLPAIPGGWRVESIAVVDRMLKLVLPARPDDFLDDPDVLAANQTDDYMPYWSYLWPSSVDMAQAVLSAEWGPDRRVLELGCGVGLVGLAALQGGYELTFSDHDPVAVQTAVHNARLNGLERRAHGVVLDWREPTASRWPVIIGCEVTYEARNHSILLALLRSMLEPGGVAWFGDPGRSQAPPFIALARQYGFAVRILDRQLRPVDVASDGSYTFQLIELTF
ncbi:MAG: methyltransferase domain-containing protein [Planctomycetaceae bacterium]